MELGNHNLIKGLVRTPKSTDLFRRLGKITLVVDKKATKLTVRKAVETIWDVKVDSVCVITTKGKTRRFAGKKFKSADKKKAIITLKKGYKIDLPGQIEGQELSPSSVGSAESEGN